MRVALLGAGAVGCYLASMLSEVAEVTLVVRPHQEATLKEQGVMVEGLVRRRSRSQVVTQVEELPPQDLLLLTVKSYDLEEALLALHPRLERNTPLLVVQNGLRVLDLPQRIHGSPVLLGVASFGATYLDTGRVRLAGSGGLLVGRKKGVQGTEEVVRLLQQGGLDASGCPDIRSQVWRKALVNCAINPLTALVRRSNGCLEEPELRHLAAGLFAEALAVAREEKELDLRGMRFEQVLEVVRSTAQNRSSMLQDVERGKRTEIEVLNGEICRRGRRVGIAVPLNDMVYHLVDGMGRG